MNPVISFHFNHCPVRVMLIKGEPWVIARDVMDAIGYSRDNKPARLLHRIKEISRMEAVFVGSAQAQRPMKVISPECLNSLLDKSLKAEAEAFRQWFQVDALPQAREMAGKAALMPSADNLPQAWQSRSITVPFHGDMLYLVEHNGEPYTPMKPIVEGMGLDWGTQYRKIAQRFNTCIVEMTIQLPNELQRRAVSCFALRKLPGWLYSISPNKVAPALREKIIQYQDECDDVLWRYWTDGNVANPSKPKPSKQITSSVTHFRQTRAIRVATDAAERIFANLPHLTEESKQAIYANLINPIAEREIIPLPVGTADILLQEVRS